MKNRIDKWVISTSEEYFSSEEFATKEDAINSATEELNIDTGDSFYIGKTVKYELPFEVPQHFCETWCERNCEEVGDWSEWWELSIHKKNDLKKEIDIKLEEINQLIMKKHTPNFYLIKDVEVTVAR